MKKMIVLVLVSVLSVFAVFGLIVAYNNHQLTKAMDLPMLYIETEGDKEIVSKEDYLDCKISISNTKKQYKLDDENARVRGRGNSTWFMYEKKPYKIKFDEKVNLFGNGKAKEWTLIANHGDPSLIRNYLAYSVARKFQNLEFTTSTQFVDLYVNGKYMGMYLVCEQVEVREGRVEIDDNLSIVDTGYLLELDDKIINEGIEGRDYFYSNELSFAIKSPDTEDIEFTSEHYNFIKGYFDETFDVLKGSDYTKVTEKIDVESFAESYIVNELFKPTDVWLSSFYIYKDAGGKLESGPVWDYDLSSGNNEKENNATKAKSLHAVSNVFYRYLLRFDEFEALVSDKLEEYESVIRKTIKNEVKYVKENYFNSANRNFKRYKILGIKIWGNSKKTSSINTWEGQVDYLEDWLEESLDFILETYND